MKTNIFPLTHCKFSLFLKNAYLAPILFKLSNQCNQSGPVQSPCPTNSAKMIAWCIILQRLFLKKEKKNEKKQQSHRNPAVQISIPLTEKFCLVPLGYSTYSFRAQAACLLGSFGSGCFSF